MLVIWDSLMTPRVARKNNIFMSPRGLRTKITVLARTSCNLSNRQTICTEISVPSYTVLFFSVLYESFGLLRPTDL
jgi:hypothetical protein